MKNFRTQSPHREVMTKLSKWCDEASVAHWSQEEQEHITWDEVAEQLLKFGRLSKVDFPSKDQADGQIVVT